ncbi:unnamed protein product [Caenorhabditis bovis]|uniref:UBA domain-containing protein n=1 Tax=Caenorhabditis bovis TaxID=2654633 RepID=A0A8S1F1R0_9PELO|nr:unnamed protein product [Caenorhabditis bovis]
MVKVFYNATSHNVGINELRENRHQLINKLTGVENPENFGITFNGKLVTEEIDPSIKDTACFRIVPLKKHQEAVANEEDIEKIIKRAYRHKNESVQLSLHGYATKEVCFPGFAHKILEKYPDLKNDPVVLVGITDLSYFCFIFGENNKDQLRQFFRHHPRCIPVYLDALTLPQYDVSSQFYTNNSIPYFRAPAANQPPPVEAGPIAAPAASVISQQDLASALASIPTNPPMIPQALPDYTAQLEQLAEFGFADATLGLLALQQTNGDVQAALELLLDMTQ